MQYTFRYYNDADYLATRELVFASYQWSVPSWGLNRHEFICGLHPAFVSANGSWRRTTGLWFDGDHLAAAVVSEGNDDGGAFLLFDRESRMHDPDLLDRLFFHAETHIARFDADSGERRLDMHIPDACPVLRDFARARGYSFSDQIDRMMIMPFPEAPFDVKLPAGFSIRDGRETPAFFLANVHAFSFQYGPPYTNTGEQAFSNLRQMPAYRPELDLTVIDPEGKPAGIAIIWYDPSLPYCELEPLGVVWWYRRMGLARALIYEAANRVMCLGPSRGMLGGDQAFYTDLGFRHEASDEFWQWRRKVR